MMMMMMMMITMTTTTRMMMMTEVSEFYSVTDKLFVWSVLSELSVTLRCG